MIQRGLTFTETVTMITESCCNCGLIFAMTSDLNKELRNSPGSTFYCPKGHAQHYTGKSDAQKLKDLQAQLEQKNRQILYEESIRIAAQNERDKLQKKLKRVHNGVCPCCDRSFENLRRHMETKHPEELKNFLELINNPNAKGSVFLKQLTVGEKRKLKKKNQ